MNITFICSLHSQNTQLSRKKNFHRNSKKRGNNRRALSAASVVLWFKVTQAVMHSNLPCDRSHCTLAMEQKKHGNLSMIHVSESWPDDLDCSDATFPSVDLLELLSLSSLTDWISVSSCVASGATIAFILLSTSLDDNFRSRNWDCKLSSAPLPDAAETCASPISINCRVGVLFSSDIVGFLINGEKSPVL